MSEDMWGNICNREDTCATTGAAALVAGINDAEVLVNGPLWCYFYAMRYLEHVDPRIAQRFRGSQPDNTAIIYGAEPFIVTELQQMLLRGRNPALLLLENSCAMSLIGDDLSGIVRSLNLPFPVITMDCGGMIGGFAEGYSKACIKVLQKFVDPNDVPTARTVNLLGLTEFYLNGRGDIAEIRRLLQLAGYIVQAVPGGGSSLNEIIHIKKAALNIVCNEELGLPVAKFLESQFGMPYLLVGMPYGVEGTIKWLHRIHKTFPSAGLIEVEHEADILHNRFHAWNNEIRSLWGSLWFNEAVVSAPPTVALCIAQALRSEWVDLGKLTVICQNKIQNQSYCSLADNIYTVGVDNTLIEKCFEPVGDLLLLGSSSESSVLRRKKGKKFVSLNIAFPDTDEVIWQDDPCVGLVGSRHMIQRLWNEFIKFCMRKAKI